MFVVVPDKLDINLVNLKIYLERKRFSIKVEANLGLTFDLPHNVEATVLKSGIMIIKGIKEKEEAFNIFRDVTGKQFITKT